MFFPYGPVNEQFGQMYFTLCSLQLAHLPIGSAHIGQGKVVDPLLSNPFPHEIHLSAFFIGGAEYNSYF
jgi:hypothetical protein